MRRLALYGALSDRAAGDAIKVIEEFDWTEPKTKAAQQLLTAIGTEGHTLVVLGRGDAVAELAFRNLAGALAVRVDLLTTYDVMRSTNILFTSASLEALSNDDSYEVSDSDFVREDVGTAPAEATEGEEA